MRIYGLDFTSAPTSKKAKNAKRLMLAICDFDKGVLHVKDFQLLNGVRKGDYSAFESWLSTPGTWVAGIDFPFGQPVRLIDDLKWPSGSWTEYVDYVASLKKNGFETTLIDYKKGKPDGQKELRRESDVKASSISPMKLNGIPVAKMFFEGAPRLVESKLSIHPIRTNSDERHVVEAYPKLVAIKWIGRKSYKNDDLKKSTSEMKQARCDLVNAIRGHRDSNSRSDIIERYGFKVVMDDADALTCVEDFTGDQLDSVLCAIQAAWAYSKRDANYGIPATANVLEGWICDPGMNV